MAVPHVSYTWANGATITAALLNALETDLAAAGITTVTLNTVAAGTSPTGSFANNTLTLNIPASSSGGTGGTIVDASTTSKGVIQLAGDLTGTAVSPQLAAVATAGTYGTAGVSLSITIDAKGRVTGTTTNPITATTVGLGNVNNTSDANKPISTATAAALAAKADLVGGVIPTTQIPSISLETVVPVASRTAMLALTSTQVQPGDIAVDTSNTATRGSYMLTATDPSQIANWVLLNAPLDAVQSVNGQQGTVVLAAADVGAASTTALAGKAPLLTPTSTQTAPYTAAANDLALMNVAAGATTLTLPSAPADKTQVGVRAIGATAGAPLTVLRSGTDTIGTAGAVNTILIFPDEVNVFQYDAANTRWLGLSNIKSQAALDGRYFPSMSPLKPTAASTSAIILRDTFTDTAGVALTAHIPDVNPSSWTAVTGTFQITAAGKLAGNSSNDSDIATLNVPNTAGNFTLSCDVTSSASTTYGARYAAQIIFAWTDSSNFFYFVPYTASDVNQWLLYRVTAGTHSIIWQSRTNAPVSGTTYTVRIDRIGPDITITINGTEFGTVSDNQGLSATSYGVRLGKGSSAGPTPATWDNLSVTLCQGAIYNWPRLAKDAANPIAALNTTTRTDTASYTSGSATINDAAILATDKGRPLKTASGIPSGSYVGTVTAGTSFLLSSSPTSQVNVNATATVSSGSIILGYWNGADLNDPCVAWDPVNNRWVLAGTGYFNDSTDPGIQTIGVYYAANLEGPWTPDTANPVLSVPSDGKYNMNGGLIWWIDRWILSSGAVNSSTFSFYTSTDLKTWTRLTNTFLAGAAGSFDSGGVFDSFLRVRQDGVTIELWYSAIVSGGNGARKLGMAYSRDGANTWTRSTTAMISPPLFDVGGGGGGNYFAEPSVFVPPGKEGREMLVFYDFSYPDVATARRIGQAITVDGGATWHHRVAVVQGTGWESNQVFDSCPVFDRGRFHLFYGGANTAGAALNLNIQIGHASTVYDPSTLLVAAATG